MEGCFDSDSTRQTDCVCADARSGRKCPALDQAVATGAGREEKDENGRPRRRRNDKGTPQGGVVSPLLANIYLHWFDRVFYAKAGPARWAKAVLVRYADDFVILTREVEGKLRKFVEEKIEVWL